MRSIRTLLLALLALAAAAGYLAWQVGGRHEPLPEGLIAANGRIEGDRITVASKVPGRVVELLAREGDEVNEGQLLLRLEDHEARARLQAAERAVDAARSRVDAAEKSFRQTARDLDRTRRLYREGTAPKRELELAETAWRVARDELDGARASLAQAEAGRDEVAALLEDLSVHAPRSGVITTRIVDVGEVVAAGTPLMEIVDLDRLYLKVYIPEKSIGKVRLGLPARLWVDAFPDRPFAATVRYIASRAEFTPREVQTPDERVKLVYAVKLYLEENPHRRLTPGMPADAVIRWREEAPWTRPRW